MNVLYPAQPGQVPPTITRWTDGTVEINDGSHDDVISVNETNSSPASTLVLLTAAPGGGGSPPAIVRYAPFHR
jgi:hypothetical protein